MRRAASTPASAAATISSVSTRALVIARTWRSAPWATSSIARAISVTARPASSELDAICCEEAATVSEVEWMRRISAVM